MKRHSYQRAARNDLERGIIPQPLPPVEPFRSSVNRPRFLVPARTKCAVSPVAHLDWREYVTTRDTGFDRFERYERTDSGHFYEFRADGWLILVHRRHVIHRDDKPIRA